MSPEEARSSAVRTLGGITLCRSPGFSALAVLCLTLGIGANAAVFSWIEGLLFRPYPMVAHQERLLAMAGKTKGGAGVDGLSVAGLPGFREKNHKVRAHILDPS